MTVFKTVIIDKETDMQVVATECTFNGACEYLAQYGEPDGVRAVDTRWTVIQYGRIDYYYDEERGYLLRVA